MSSVPYYKVNNERLYLKEVNEGEETTLWLIIGLADRGSPLGIGLCEESRRSSNR